MPAARIRATNGASRPVTLAISARLPAVVGSGPAASILSLISTGLPAIGPARPLVDAARLRDRGRVDRDDRMELAVDGARTVDRARL